MIRVTVKIDATGALARLARAKNQTRFATSMALSNTAKAIAQEDVPASIRKTFKSHVAFTERAAYYRRATKSDLQAEVGLKDKQGEYLRAEIFGGGRQPAIEKLLAAILPPGMWVVPTRFSKTTSNGKISIACLRKIVSDVAGASSRGKTKRRSFRPMPYVVAPGDPRVHPGIWQRQGTQTVPLLLFVKQPKYPVRWRFADVVSQAARRRFPAEFQRAIRYALDTIK